MKMRTLSLFLLGVSLTSPVFAAPPPEFEGWVRTIRATRGQGQGNVEAARVWQHLAKLDARELPAVLGAMDGAGDFALNWFRAAVDAIADHAHRHGQALPIDALKKFLGEPEHHPRARRLAYELVVRADDAGGRALLPRFLNDSSTELRREAVEQVIAEARQNRQESGGAEGAAALYRKALAHARDVDQVERLAKELKELGQPVDLQKTFGWLTRWKVIGPFDNMGGVGFERVFPPEERIDLTAEYDGKSGKVRWQDFESKDDYGMVDFNKPFTALKGVAGYAYTEFTADAARSIELRLGGKNAWKVWLNGQYLFGRDEYHRGAEIDQYRLRAELKPGRNTILVKCCQNEQKEDWTVEWQFQLRLTDALGTPIAAAR